MNSFVDSLVNVHVMNFLMILCMLAGGLQACGGVPSFDLKDFTSNA